MLVDAIAKGIERDCPATDQALSLAEIREIAEAALSAAHTYMLGHAQVVSNTGRPYLDNNYGRCALELLREIDPKAASDIMNK
jgi:hypothetical protein